MVEENNLLFTKLKLIDFVGKLLTNIELQNSYPENTVIKVILLMFRYWVREINIIVFIGKIYLLVAILFELDENVYDLSAVLIGREFRQTRALDWS